MAFYEITVASADQPKLLSRLSEALVSACNYLLGSQCSGLTPLTCIRQSDIGLNIREAHAFNTNDRFSLDVFVVDMADLQVGCSVRCAGTSRRRADAPEPSSALTDHAARTLDYNVAWNESGGASGKQIGSDARANSGLELWPRSPSWRASSLKSSAADTGGRSSRRSNPDGASSCKAHGGYRRSWAGFEISASPVA